MDIKDDLLQIKDSKIDELEKELYLSSKKLSEKRSIIRHLKDINREQGELINYLLGG